MASFDQWATPTSQKAASASLYDAGGFDDELPPPSSDQPQGSSYVKTALSSRGPVIETKNSHLLELTQPPTWQTDAGESWRCLAPQGLLRQTNYGPFPKICARIRPSPTLAPTQRFRFAQSARFPLTSSYAAIT